MPPHNRDPRLGVAAWVNLGDANTHVLENASKVDTSKIAELNSNQASQRPKKPRGKTAPDRHPDALDENDGHQGQQRPDGKDRSRSQAGKKVKCDHGYQICLQGRMPILGA